MYKRQAYKVFQAGAYDSVIMDYLCEHFNGTVSQMYEVLIQGVREHVETYDLEERLLCQMLFTGCCEQMDSVFELYMNRKPTREIIVKAYFTQKCVQYFLECRDMDGRVFEYLKQAVAGSLEKDRMPTIYLLALTKYCSTLDKLDAEDADPVSYTHLVYDICEKKPGLNARQILELLKEQIMSI